VVDTTGAGDAFSAALAVALAEGRELVDAAAFAVRAGALAVTKPEVVPALPTRAEVEQTAGIGPSLESK
jgi:ribokinase